MRYAIHTSGAQFPDTNRLFQCNSLPRLSQFMAHYREYCKKRGYTSPEAYDQRLNRPMRQDANGAWAYD